MLDVRKRCAALPEFENHGLLDPPGHWLCGCDETAGGRGQKKIVIDRNSHPKSPLAVRLRPSGAGRTHDLKPDERDRPARFIGDEAGDTRRLTGRGISDVRSRRASPARSPFEPCNRHDSEIRDIRQCAAAPRAYNCSPTFERPDQLAAAIKEKPGA